MCVFMCVVFVCVFSFTVQDDWTPLHHACEQSNNEVVVGLLLDRGADINATNSVRVSTHTQHGALLVWWWWW